VTEFTNQISNRIAETRQNLRQAQQDDEHYLVEVRLGELESLARLAADHGLEVDGVAESLAEYGLTTPATGLPTAPLRLHLDARQPLHTDRAAG